MAFSGVTAKGIVSPIFSRGDDVVSITCDTLIAAAKGEGFEIEDGDICGITESIVARAQGNYASCAQIAADIKLKLGGKDMGIVFPILSRNRFSILLKAMAQSCQKLYVQLSYPSDEVGNAIITQEQLDSTSVNPFSDSFDEQGFRAVFGSDTVHPFTGVDYIEFYKSFGSHIEIIFSNDPAYILNFTKNVLCCDIHTRARTKNIIKKQGGQRVFGLDDILTQSVEGSGFNPEFGLLGSNMATEDSVKLFPRDCQPIVDSLQRRIFERTQKNIEVLIYGDGCFKDPVGGIWEFADPVVAPAFTPRLAGTPNELKMKYVADNQLRDLSGEELALELKRAIKEKESDLKGKSGSLGTTPRRYIDLVGSLCDLISGSGDRGTPIVYIKGYFTNYAT